MKERFENRKISGNIRIKMDDSKGFWVAEKEQVVKSIIAIGNEYLNQGFTLTLRQLYYQLVARDIIPNHDKVYSKISSIKDDVVYSGLLDWEVFEDRGRVPKMDYFEHSIPDALSRTLRSYRLDKQIGQPIHIEVWTEKDAISSILRRVTDEYTIMLSINKGYTSSSAIYLSYERFVEQISNNKKVKILYFGDHDPSGLDMIRDIRDRITFMLCYGQQLYSNVEEKLDAWWEHNQYTYYDIANEVEGFEDLPELFDREDDNAKVIEKFEAGRLAMYIKENELFEIVPVGLTMEQIKKYNPPHNPAKITDPRAKEYVRNFGKVSWEVDALNPTTMMEIVREAINKYLDQDALKRILKKQSKEQAKLKEIIKTLKNDE